MLENLTHMEGRARDYSSKELVICSAFEAGRLIEIVSMTAEDFFQFRAIICPWDANILRNVGERGWLCGFYLLHNTCSHPSPPWQDTVRSLREHFFKS